MACLLETSHATFILCSRYFLKFQFESYFPPSPDFINQIVNLSEVVFPKLPLVRHMYNENSKERITIHHDDLKQRIEDINKRDQPLRKGSQDREDSLGFRYQHFPPYSTV